MNLTLGSVVPLAMFQVVCMRFKFNMLLGGFKLYASKKIHICKKKTPNILNFKHKWQQVLSAYKCKSLFAFQGLGTLAISERVCIDIQLERFNVNFFEKRTNAIKPSPAPSLAI